MNDHLLAAEWEGLPRPCILPPGGGVLCRVQCTWRWAVLFCACRACGLWDITVIVAQTVAQTSRQALEIRTMIKFAFPLFVTLALTAVSFGQCPNGQCQAPSNAGFQSIRRTTTTRTEYFIPPPPQIVVEETTTRRVVPQTFYYVPAPTQPQFYFPQAVPQGNTQIYIDQRRRWLIGRIFGW